MKKTRQTKKKDKEPLVRCSGTLTESGYLAWIRSALRSRSLRWPPRAECLERARKPYKGPNKRQKWVYVCAMCKGDTFTGKDVVVDHYPVEAGSILSVEDIGPFAERLYCEVDNLRCLCVECHRKHTLASSKGISYEEAAIEIQVNDIMKDKKKALDMLAKNGYSGKEVSNDDKRKALLKVILTNKQEG